MPAVVQAIIWEGKCLRLLDQRELPLKIQYLQCTTHQAVVEAIHSMAVRGAPAIGIAAAYGLVLAVINHEDYLAAEQALADSRPTAVNLRWALERMRRIEQRSVDALLKEAIAIHHEDLAQNLKMGELGAALLPEGATVLTHCNTGALATGGHGTALGVIRSAHAAGKLKAVFNTETRPWLQGARLTAFELMQEGIPAKLIADGAAAHLMSKIKIDWVIVGADRIAANGDTANKIGTYGVAVLARAHDIPFYVAAPSSTFDLRISDGSQIPIEQRDPREITEGLGKVIAPAGIRVYNPAFDVTPAALINGIITEKGLIHPVNEQGIRGMLGGADLLL